MLKLIITLLILSLPFNVIGQNRPVEFGQLKALQAIEPKTVVVLVMTNWCKYCHAMQNTMLKNTKVSSLLRDNFYTVFLNAEEKNDILFAGREFKLKKGINELATELATVNGRVTYPTLCILSAKNEIMHQFDGFLSAKALEYSLKKIAAIRK